jgi:sulfur relay (sulfurtransferase) complex TusBCD TusD component (DsrE family)
MKIGIVICSNDVETAWNAIRYANFCIAQKDEVKIFLIGKGVEYQKISTDKFNTVEQMDKYLETGGKLYACGSCMKSREKNSSQACPLSTMKDMYDIVKESDKVVTF